MSVQLVICLRRIAHLAWWRPLTSRVLRGVVACLRHKSSKKQFHLYSSQRAAYESSMDYICSSNIYAGACSDLTFVIAGGRLPVVVLRTCQGRFFPSAPCDKPMAVAAEPAGTAPTGLSQIFRAVCLSCSHILRTARFEPSRSSCSVNVFPFGASLDTSASCSRKWAFNPS